MSAKIMGEVFDLDLPHAEMLVLLALADHADHVAMNVRPGLPRIAWKTGYSLRQVRRIVAKLVQSQILVLLEERVGDPILYGIDLSKATRKAPFGSHVEPYAVGQNVRGGGGQDVRPDKMSPRTPSCPGGADIAVSGGADIAVSAKPSEPSVNHHTHRARAETGVGVGSSQDQGEARKREQRAKLVELLEQLSVADGEAARRRWWRMARANRRVEDFDDVLDLIHDVVHQARDAGRVVNYASDVADLARAWWPRRVPGGTVGAA